MGRVTSRTLTGSEFHRQFMEAFVSSGNHRVPVVIDINGTHFRVSDVEFHNPADDDEPGEPVIIINSPDH